MLSMILHNAVIYSRRAKLKNYKAIIARGTIEQIRELALAHNLNWDEEYYTNSTGATSTLGKRRANDFNALGITCGGRWHAVSYTGRS
ncbi:hypothetical protein BDW75DRAFT_245898 [Aspergillus navahoensis]